MNDLELVCFVVLVASVLWYLGAGLVSLFHGKDTDDSGYSDPARPRVVEATPGEEARDVAAGRTAVAVVASEYAGSTRLTLVGRHDRTIH